MRDVVATEKLPIYIWADTDALEANAVEQACNLANLPFAFHHVALMPDAHMGYGMPIGGVLATRGVVIPNAVGVDIGCGMLALKTNLHGLDQQRLKKVLGKVRASVPVGYEHRKTPRNAEMMPQFIRPASAHSSTEFVAEQEMTAAKKQLGTLGGGNHFIEIQKGDDGHLWIMIHSGSRNVGKKVADYYNRLAKDLNKRWHSTVPSDHDLAFLPTQDDSASYYLAEMEFCVQFALANRLVMLECIYEAFSDVVPEFAPMQSVINIAHNYAAREVHYNTEVIVHRKGATRAQKDETGIIPGSQGTNSYIVRGLGAKDSFQSCSHGAGRRMGRKEAQRKLDLQAQIKLLDDKGVIHGIRAASDLDEAPGAYKDIQDVMRRQADLVEIVTELSPLAVIKG